MLDSIYIGLTGLTGYSKDLTVIGNNVANINTVGFKGQQTLFADLFYRSQFGDLNDRGGENALELGSGLGTAGTRRVFKQGELRQSGNDTDVAIDGNGFFVLRRDGQTFYTRAGQFSFDADGFLVSTSAQARVAGLEGNSLHDINIRDVRTSPAKATTKVDFAGTLSNTLAAGAPFTLAGVQAFDTGGQLHTWSLVFTNNSSVTPGSWLVKVTDEKSAEVGSGEIRFAADGTPLADFNQFEVPLPGDAAAESRVKLFFGDPGSTAGTRSLPAATSDVHVDKQDGYGVGSLTKASFDANGQLTTTYSNGQTAKRDRLALASFNELQALQPVGGSLFAASEIEAPLLGVPGEGPFGTTSSSQVELANVDLAQEFSNLIVTQRGYQASSQVISTANEMIQQLFDMKARR